MDRRRTAIGTSFALAMTLAVGAPPAAAADQATPSAPSAKTPLPPVSPSPQSVSRTGKDVRVTEHVRVVADDNTDTAARKRLARELRAHGAEQVEVVAPGDVSATTDVLTVRLGPGDREDVAEALGKTTVPDHEEAYALRVSAEHPHQEIVLAGADAAGQFYAVQTLRQLFLRGEGAGHGVDARHGPWRVAGAQVRDFPSMPLRGTIEGFYGEPWTQAERLDQMDFYGDVKANTYIYAPKDDPYHRGKWREPYPKEKLAELGELVDRGRANHVRFTFAVSPGGSICYSDKDDREKLTAKLQSLYDEGTRTFSIPLDDISYTEWNCEGDRAEYGEPGRKAAAKAQVDLLNDVQRNFIATHEGARPLQMVPTEYGDLTDSAYKKTLRKSLDKNVEVMWTGTAVVPPKITNEQADKAAELFGREVFVWDNYPVNDFDKTKGRLLLAPYDKREAGLSKRLSGIVANPMNQPYASKIAVFGSADFAWNDRDYDAGKSWPRALSYLAGGDAKAAEALRVFADLNHLAPTFGDAPWQQQAPDLRGHVEDFWQRWDEARRGEAVTKLREYAQRIERAPATIRDGAVQEGFTADAKPWLTATELWGGAMVSMLDALEAHGDGDRGEAEQLLKEAQQLREQARKVRVDPPRNAWGKAQPRIGDGVLDTFLTDAEKRLEG